MKPLLLVFVAFSICFCNNTVSIEITIDELLSDSNYYLSSLSEIRRSTDNKLVLKGIRGKQKNITGKLFSEIIQLSKSTVYPECIIDHTPREADAYYAFNYDLVTRPKNSDVSKAVSNWENAITYQIVRLNFSRKTDFAHDMFNADLKLKQLIMGKKLMRVRGVKSFAGYAESELYDAMNHRREHAKTIYGTKFYLVPDTIILKKSENSVVINKTKFKIMSSSKFNQTNDRDIFEDAWSDQFNRNADKIITKHKELCKIMELFKLYFVFKEFSEMIVKSNGINTENDSEVPESIKALKICVKLSVSDPLINEPARYRFEWLLMSGAITFDYQGAYVKIE